MFISDILYLCFKWCGAWQETLQNLGPDRSWCFKGKLPLESFRVCDTFNSIATHSTHSKVRFIFFTLCLFPPTPESNSFSRCKNVDAEGETKANAKDRPANKLQVFLPPVLLRITEYVETSEKAGQGSKDMIHHAHSNVILIVPSHDSRAKADARKNQKSR